MGKIAFVFSGQGDQYPGMGKSLYEQDAAAAEIFRRCEAIRPGTMEQCFNGPAEKLLETKHTQPCLFAMELAAAEALSRQGIRPDAVAGFSLGEMAAAVFAGLFDLETGFRLVCKRGELMQADAEKFDTAMVAVVRLEEEQLRQLAAQHGVYPVNFNCPGQISVSGLKERMTAFSAAVKAAGGRALPLKVQGAFHSPFMQDAAAAFGEELARVSIRPGRLPLYSNLTAEPYAGDAAALLAAQIASPVQWERLIRNMIAAGFDRFVEIGPGSTLSNMIGKIDGQVKTFCVSKPEALLAEVKPC